MSGGAKGGTEVSGEYLIKGARLLGGEPADLLVRDGVIAAVGPEAASATAQVVDADGLIALPGLVDLHTHLREPGREDAETVESGTAAAALGGFTAVHAMANTSPVADTAGVVEQVWRLGREAGHCDVQPVGAVTAGLQGERLAELGAMADSAARVRVFSDDGKCVSDAMLMRRALEYVKAFDGVIAQHAQEPRLTEGAQMNEGEVSGRLGLVGWPAVAEEAIIARDCLLAAHVGSRLHVCHVSTAGSVEILRWAKSKGWNVTAEVTPHHLLLTDELVEHSPVGAYNPIYKVNPPLRTREDVEALRAGARRRHDRLRRHRPRPAPGRGQGDRVGRGRDGHDRPGDRAVGGAAGDGRHRPARLGRRRRPHVVPARPDRPPRRPRPAAAARRAREPHPVRPVGEPPGGAVRLRLAQPQHPLHRHGPARPRRGDVPARPAHGPGREAAMSALLVLEDGRVFHGEPFGAVGETFGEMVFNTAMTGYQETLTDPSYHRQIVAMTAPHIGNTGVNDEDPESRRVWVAGYVVREPSRIASSWRAARGLEDELRAQGVVGIAMPGTRALTRHLRERGAMRAGVFSGDAAGADVAELVERVRQSPSMIGADLAREVATRRAVRRPGARADRGTGWPPSTSASRRMTPHRMAERGCEVHVLPATSTAADILALDPDGVFFSNGPGDPAAAGYAVEAVRGVLDSGTPVFGICFGNQILGRALGLDTYKLRYGHRGVNQPVRTAAPAGCTSPATTTASRSRPRSTARSTPRTAGPRSATSTSTTTAWRGCGCSTTRRSACSTTPRRPPGRTTPRGCSTSSAT